MNYIDTCCLISFIDKRDRIRRITKTDRVGNIESVFGRHNTRFIVPVPALGETVQKIHDKGWSHGAEVDAHSELVRLMRTGFIEPLYIRYGWDVSMFLHRVMSVRVDDERDRVSPMDALVTSMAVSDPDCGALYTTDRTLTTGNHLDDLIMEFREEMGYNPIRIIDIVDIMNR